LGSEPGASLAVHDSGQDLGGYQQLSSASSSETVQYIPQTHVEQTGISTALSVLRSSKRVKMPWESGPLAPIFTRESFNKRFDVKSSQLGLADVLNPRPKAQAVLSEPAAVEAPLEFVRKRIACTSYNIQDDELRSRALNRFRVLVNLDLHATGIGESMLNCVGSLDTSTDVLQVLSDALSSKATGTLLKRSSSLWRWANWVATTDRGTCFDQTEDTVYRYMNHLRDSGAAPTAASHFVEALRFSDQIFRLKKMNLHSVLTSRVTGAAHTMFLQKRKLQQAPAFTVEAVGILEDLCNEDPRAHVRVICGAILFCIFACIRWFDAMRIESVWLDNYITMCLLEAETSRHKTSMTKESKTRLLPFTSLGRFIGSADWARSFMLARSNTGLDEGKIFLPSWNEVAQTWSSCPMSSGEATCWIRELLAANQVQQAWKFSSHSCKCTLLTWAGMCTLFTREERTLLGHHVEPQTRSSTIYNRDSQILLQYKVLKLINLIRTGKLKPDVSRAERLSMMVQKGTKPLDEEVAEHWQDPDIEASDEDSQDVDLDEIGEPQSGLDDALESTRDPVPLDGHDLTWYMHAFTGVVHAAHNASVGDEQRLLCGRAITVNLNLTDPDSAETKTGLMCIQCNAVIKRDALFEEEEFPP
jgi:hypothetical protein